MAGSFQYRESGRERLRKEGIEKERLQERLRERRGEGRKVRARSRKSKNSICLDLSVHRTKIVFAYLFILF